MPVYFTIDDKELKQFKEDLLKYKDGIDTVLNDSTRELAGILYSYLVDLTNVDTGRLRSNWVMGEVLKHNNEYAVIISNYTVNKYGTEYGYFVNYGHWYRCTRKPDWYWEGSHFIERSEWKLQNDTEILNAVFNRAIKKFLDKVKVD